MGGILSYISIFFLVAIWMLGWLGITLMLGAVFDLPVKGVAITGAVLGPLGFLAILFVGIAVKQPHKQLAVATHRISSNIHKSDSRPISNDPFA